MTATCNTSAQEDFGFWRKLLNDVLLHRKLFWILTLLIVAADLWSKDAAITFVKDKMDSGEIIQEYWVAEPWFSLVDVKNTGGPWGVGSDYAQVLKVIRILALGVILYILAGTSHRNRFQQLALAMVMGGAVGNIWDSLTLGHVRDFLKFDLDIPLADPLPAFNLADAMICTGVFCLALSMIVTSFASRGEGSKEADGEASG